MTELGCISNLFQTHHQTLTKVKSVYKFMGKNKNLLARKQYKGVRQ